MKKSTIFLFLMVVQLAGAPAQVSSQKELSDDVSKLRFAAGQHEIIAILLQQGRYNQALVEYQKILQLEIGSENEKALVQEGWLVAEQLRQAGQWEMAHKVIDLTLPRLKLAESKFPLLMAKGKVYKDQGLPAKAIEVYRQAQALQRPQ